mmetsp:Transcript_12384/g.25474  ORF Transcript_12384/g.25474 Transcript_12384/m.25474 type:complete len:213 (+) Transcript_12384:357-995(+)
MALTLSTPGWTPSTTSLTNLLRKWPCFEPRNRWKPLRQTLMQSTPTMTPRSKGFTQIKETSERGLKAASGCRAQMCTLECRWSFARAVIRTRHSKRPTTTSFAQLLLKSTALLSVTSQQISPERVCDTGRRCRSFCSRCQRKSTAFHGSTSMRLLMLSLFLLLLLLLLIMMISSFTFISIAIMISHKIASPRLWTICRQKSATGCERCCCGE